MSNPIRVLVADDQGLVREGLMTLLQTADGIEPVACAGDGLRPSPAPLSTTPTWSSWTCACPASTGWSDQADPRRAPEHEVVVLTTHADEASILDALRGRAPAAT